MSATARRRDRSVPRTHLAVRTATALALALLSLPLFSPPAFAEGEDPGAPPADLTAQSTVEETTPEPPDDSSAQQEPEAETPPADSGTSDEGAGETTGTPPEEEAVTTEETLPDDEAPAPDEGAAPGATSDGSSVEVQGSDLSLKADGPVIQLDPADADCTVDTFKQNTQENGGGSWINGALNQNNSNYAEGDYVPQRVELTGLAPGEYTFQFTYDRTKNGKYAYDFVDHLYISGSEGADITWDAFTGPAPAPFAETVLVTITFTITSDTDETATIGWDGHISSELDYGPNSSAGSISGAPYHFSLLSTEGQFGCDTGSRDNQLMADAVDFGTITVVKDAQPNDAQNFHFSLAAPNNLGTSFDLDDDGDGTLPNSWTLNVPPGDTTITEENIPAGWTLTDISCTDPGIEVGNAVTVTVSDDELITCTFTNSRESSLVVDKFWVINGGNPVADGTGLALQLELDADLTVDGNAEEFGDELTGYLQGGSVSIDEDVTFGNPLCDWADPLVQGSVTEDNGDTPADGSLPYDAALDEVDNHVTVTNTVWCDSELILSKVVENPNGGTAVASDFTLIATPQGGGAALESTGSEAGEAFLVDPDETFDLTEGEDGPDGYTLTSIVCDNEAATSVQVPIGTSVECVFTNADSPGSLELDKEVDDNNTGDLTPESEWHLSATPDQIDGQATIEGDGHADGPTKAGTYVLDEEGPDTHTEGTWDCIDSEGADVPVNGANEITIAAAQVVSCEITNTAIRPSLTLIKHVDPGDTGDDTGAEEFELTATPDGIEGQAVLSGPGPEVSADVRVGTYALSEDGPDTYVADEEGWTCSVDGGESFDPEGDMVDVGVAEDVVCEITNNAVPSSWMVEKSSNPASGTVNPNDEIDYTITVTKVGDGVNVLDIEVTDTLTGVDMAWVSDVTASAGIVTPGDGTLTWNIDELGDTPLTLTYTVTVGDEAWDATLHNVVTPGPTPCVDPDESDPFLECDETTHWTPHFTLDKAVELLADPGDDDGLAEPGEYLEYTLTMTNDTEHALLEDAVVTDDLSDVLNNAGMVTTTEELAALGLELSGTTLTWTVDELAPGDTVEVSYVVEIDDGAWGVTLHNIATPAPDGPGECIPPGDIPNDEENTEECETTTDTPEVTTMVVEKQDLESGEVLEGATFQLYLDANNALDEEGNCTFASPPVVDADDELLGTEVTGGDGQSLFPELQHGCYLLVETAPPPGYELPEVNVMGIQVDELNFVGGGEMAAIVVTDFAEGLLAIVAKRQFELIDDVWVESDGVVDFGDTVRYEVRVSATGPKNFHDVLVTDYVPGFNPDDTTSTVEGTLVPGSAVCEGTLTCTVSVDPETQLVTWDIGDVEPPLGETLSTVAVMEVVFPELPPDLDLDPGESFEASLWNIGYLSWREVSGLAPAQGGGLGRVANVATVDFTFIDHELVSNEVVVTATVTARPRPPGKDDPDPKPDLPDTGAMAGLGTLAGLGGLLVALGAVLLRRRRNPGDPVTE